MIVILKNGEASATFMLEEPEVYWVIVFLLFAYFRVNFAYFRDNFAYFRDNFAYFRVNLAYFRVNFAYFRDNFAYLHIIFYTVWYL